MRTHEKDAKCEMYNCKIKIPKCENKTHEGIETKPGVREPKISKGHAWPFNSRWQAASIRHDWFAVEQRWENRDGTQSPP